jgi:hypothetical protein
MVKYNTLPGSAFCSNGLKTPIYQLFPAFHQKVTASYINSI